MLHTVILRLSLWIGIVLFALFGALNIYKKDIILFSLERALPHSVIECERVDGFFPLNLELKNVKIKNAAWGEIYLTSVLLDVRALGFLSPPFNAMNLIHTFKADYLFQKENFKNSGTLALKDEKLIIQTHYDKIPLEIKAGIKDFQNIPFSLHSDKGQAEGFLKHFNNLMINTIHFQISESLWLKNEKPFSIALDEKKIAKETNFFVGSAKFTLDSLSFQDTLKGKMSAHIPFDLLKKDLPFAESNAALTLTADISGSFDNPHIQAKLSSTPVNIKNFKHLSFLQANIKAVYQHHILSLEGALQEKQGLNLKIKGTATPENLQIKASTEGNFSYLKSFLPKGDHLGGAFKGDFALSGPLLSPHFDGNIVIKNGLYQNFAIGTHIKNLQGTIKLLKDHASLDLQGKDDFKGTLNATGKIPFDMQSSGVIDLELKQFYLGQSDLFTGRADGHLFIDLFKKTIKGLLNLNPVVVDIDQLTPSATPRIYFTDGALKNDDITAQPSDSGFHFDIRLVPTKPVVVRGFGIESTWNGGLSLQGNTPDFVGEFTLEKGNVDITGRILNFTRGKIIFDHKINNPHLDLEIMKKIDGYEVFIQLYGRPKDTRFTLISRPGLSQEEILALILFGRKSATTSLGQLFDVSASLSSLSSAGQDKSFFTTFRKLFGIDALEIKNKDQTSPSESPQALSIRKQISPDFSVVIEQAISAADEESKESKAIIEKQLSDNWSLDFDVSTNKSGGVGLSWIKRY